MAPENAIVEMLNFDEHNFKLSPTSSLDSDLMASRPTTLRALSDFWSSDDPNNTMPSSRRQGFQIGEWNSAVESWSMMAATRGANPFRERIGFWETNFHLAINQSAGVSVWQIFHYYDTTMNQQAQAGPYQEVITEQALNAAIASLYGYVYDRYYGGICYCNEDFAREYHQLGFGILGTSNPTYHESVSIKNTAAALTGAERYQIEAPNAWEGEDLQFLQRGPRPWRRGGTWTKYCR